MSSRQYRRPYARQRKDLDNGEEEGFLYCLMYYFDEARRESEGSDKKTRKNRKYLLEEEEEAEEKRKKKASEEEEEVLNPLVYREHYGAGRNTRGGMMHRRAYTPDRDTKGKSSSSSSSSSSSFTRFRAHSQPPEVVETDYVPMRRYRRKRK